MSLNLDKRQRAMLREMGVRVWQPAVPEYAIEVIADTEDVAPTTGQFHAEKSPQIAAVVTPPVRQPAPASVAPAVAPAARPQPDARGASAWRLGQAQALYADSAQSGGARWLVLAETPAAALSGPLLQGDSGKLLDNMLRAARLNQVGAVLLAPLARQAAGAVAEDFLAALSALLLSARPDVVLVMGRLATQALLASSEPFGKLRGQVHQLQGVSAIVTYDAAYLLRSPADKAKAWDDLCLAMSLQAKA
ncbi:DNA polymerase [Polaromonas sp. OV174]|uniref:uracil-DNA glycosylase family protein n=1 Tax=Polaromonas sp. OV174 TaxID=1855300 RepID=UPI0008EBB24D|nr:uracil-DNA glycosylase family protein [Polaromonas sp. OV174]SFC31203.1 DNA polymerase [Polaromonas sp. OV174]